MDYINDKVFIGENFTEKAMEKEEFEFCKFENCDFSNSNLSKIRFIDSTFTDCNLSNVKLYATWFQEVKMVNCKMLGLHFDTCDPFNFSIDFDTCILNHSIFYQSKLDKTTFNNLPL